MEIVISLTEDEENLVNETIGQFTYFLRRELNEEELDRLYKVVFLRGTRNHYEISQSVILALGGFAPYDPEWRNFSQEESEGEEFENLPAIAEC